MFPDFITHFSDFDINSWMLLYHYPTLLAGLCNKPKRKALAALIEYPYLPLSSRNEVAPVLQLLEVK